MQKKPYEFEFSIPEPIKHFARIRGDLEARTKAYFKRSHPHMDITAARKRAFALPD